MRKRSWVRNLGSLAVLLAITSLWCGRVLALNPQRSITQYGHVVWDRKQGLTQDLVTAITQTRDGYLWFANQEGLMRFDGVRFTVFNKSNTKGINSNAVNRNAIYESRDGSLWIGTNLGLTRYKDGAFTTYSTQDGLSSENALSIYEDRAGSLWVGTADGLNQFHDGKFTIYKTKDGLPHNAVLAICEDREGRLWIGTYKGLSVFHQGKFTTFGDESGLSANPVHAIYSASDGKLWVGASGGGLSLFAQGKFISYTTKQGLSNNNVTSLQEDREGNLWVGTLEGLNRLSHGELKTYTKNEGLSHNSVQTIAVDREGSLWVGTMGGGVNQFRDLKYTPYTSKEGLLGEDAWSIMQDQKGSIWIGTYSGLNQFQDGKFKSYTAKDGLSGNNTFAIYEDREQSLWVGSFGGGLTRFKDGKFKNYTNGLPSPFVMTIHEDHRGSLWVGTRGGLSRLSGDKVTTYTTSDGRSLGIVKAVIDDAAGDLWVGASGGVSRFRDGKFTTYTTKEGLASNFVNSIFEDSDGAIWVSAFGGLSRLKSGKITAYTTRDGLLNDDLLQTLEDDRGYFWMSGNRGIFRVAKKELNEFAEGKVSAVTSIPYDTSDGLSSLEFNGANQIAGTKTHDGKLWFPTTRGVVVIDPNNVESNQNPPPVVIEKVIFDKTPVTIKNQIQLPPGKGEIEIQYTGLSFVAPEKVRFKYQLEGFDSDWIDAGTRRAAYYTNLPPGNYRFRVMACNNAGVWSETEATFQFYLRPHFYQTTWFYALCLLAVILIGFGLYKLRVTQLRRRTHQLEVIVDQRTAELKRSQEKVVRLEKNATEQQMAGGFAHEMRNALAGSKLILDQALALDAPEPQVSLNLANCHSLKEIYLDLKEKLPSAETQIILGKMRVIFSNEERLNDVMRLVHKSTSRGLNITQQIMNYSKIGQQQRGQRIVNLNDLLATIISESREEFVGQGITIESNLDANALDMIGDESDFYSIFKNIVLNARDALIDTSLTNGTGLRIQITSALENDKCIVMTADNGVGIAKENLTKLFEPFFSTKPATGTGLGLSIVKKMVAIYDGTIDISSEIGKGSTVTVSFPVPINAEAALTAAG